MTKLRLVCAAAALTATASGAALAEKTGTIGIMSDYIWRGQYISNGSAYGSIDVNTDSGLYLGAWGADIQNGLEYDAYIGYVGGGDEFTWNVGLTGYYATDEAFDTLEEINLGFSYSFFDVQYSLGDLDAASGGIIANFDPSVAPQRTRKQTVEYVIATLTPEVGPYYVIGRGDYHHIRGVPTTPGGKGMWFEVGKDFQLTDGLEIGIAALYTPDAPTGPSDTVTRTVQLSRNNPFAEYALVMHISKTVAFSD